MTNRLFAIGDIHGEYRKLEQLYKTLIKKYNLNLSCDKLIFLGDYIDRGLDSYQVLDFIYKLQNKNKDNVIALAGNHEWLMIDWEEGRDRWDLWGINGGSATRLSFFDATKKKECPKKFLKWLKNLPLSHREPGFFFSHAPIGNKYYRGTEGLSFLKDDLIWSYWKGDESNTFRHKDAVGVCGHIHALSKGIFHPRLYDHYIFADAGCGCHKNAPLCAIEVVSREIIYSL